MMSKEEYQAWELVLTNFIWDSMQTNGGIKEDHIYHDLFTLHYYSTNMANNDKQSLRLCIIYAIDTHWK